MVVDFEAVETINRCSVSELEKVGQALNTEHPNSCQRFGLHVTKVQAALIHTHILVAYVAVHQENPAEAAKFWKKMSEFCDLALNALRSLKEKFPYCGTPELYDLALDYKLVADERYQENLRDSECLSLKIPENLFPKRS